MNKRRLFQVFGTVCAAGPAGWALAQFGGGMRRGGVDRGAKGDMRSGGLDGVGGKPEPTPVIEVTLHEFHKDLKLRAEQEPLFEAYAKSIRALAMDLTRERRPRASTASMSVLERIERNVDTMRNRLAAVEDVAHAAKVLWSSLNPEQQTAADPRLANLMLLPLNEPRQDGPRKPGALGGPPDR